MVLQQIPKAILAEKDTAKVTKSNILILFERAILEHYKCQIRNLYLPSLKSFDEDENRYQTDRQTNTGQKQYNDHSIRGVKIPLLTTFFRTYLLIAKSGREIAIII